jgi:hypothetical protein
MLRISFKKMGRCVAKRYAGARCVAILKKIFLRSASRYAAIKK